MQPRDEQDLESLTDPVDHRRTRSLRAEKKSGALQPGVVGRAGNLTELGSRPENDRGRVAS